MKGQPRHRHRRLAITRRRRREVCVEYPWLTLNATTCRLMMARRSVPIETFPDADSSRFTRARVLSELLSAQLQFATDTSENP